MEIMKLLLAEHDDYDRYSMSEELLQDGIINILYNRVKQFDLPVQVSKYAYIMVSQMSHGNPGMALMILRDSMKHAMRTKVSSEVTYIYIEMISVSNAVMEVVPSGYPTLEDYESRWYGQKMPNGGNKIDTREYWIEALEG